MLRYLYLKLKIASLFSAIKYPRGKHNNVCQNKGDILKNKANVIRKIMPIKQEKDLYLGINNVSKKTIYATTCVFIYHIVNPGIVNVIM